MNLCICYFDYCCGFCLSICFAS